MLSENLLLLLRARRAWPGPTLLRTKPFLKCCHHPHMLLPSPTCEARSSTPPPPPPPSPLHSTTGGSQENWCTACRVAACTAAACSAAACPAATCNSAACIASTCRAAPQQRNTAVLHRQCPRSSGDGLHPCGLRRAVVSCAGSGLLLLLHALLLLVLLLHANTAIAPPATPTQLRRWAVSPAACAAP